MSEDNNNKENAEAKKEDPQALMLRLKVNELWENEKGEFFTSKNLALLSVEQDKKKIKSHAKNN